MNEIIFLDIIIFILGGAFGSFLSVLVYRSISGKKGIITGHSACPNCHHRLSPLNLIPIFSWIFQGGRCSYCHKPISIIYPALELTTGLLFLANFNFLLTQSANPTWPALANDWLFWIKFLFFDLLSLNLLAICFADLQKKAIPDIFLYSWIALTILNLIFDYQNILSLPNNQGIAILAALLFFGLQFLLSKGRWLGSGDIYLGLGMGALLGLSKFALALICSYFIGSIIVIILLILHQVKAKQTVPFAPFLVLGTLIAFYYGDQILHWYFTSFLNLNLL